MIDRDPASDFLRTLFGYLHATPEELKYNRRRGWLYSTWRFVTLLAPQAVSFLARSMYRDAWEHREVDRSLMDTLRREAIYLIRGTAGRIVHRARILYPDGGPVERANVILIDLELVGRRLESYAEFVFAGALEIYDSKTDQPLAYRSSGRTVRTPTPPGFRTIEELKATGILRRPLQG